MGRVCVCVYKHLRLLELGDTTIEGVSLKIIIVKKNSKGEREKKGKSSETELPKPKRERNQIHEMDMQTSSPLAQ